MKTAIIIPARLESTRLPRKLLLAETGKPLIQHTYEAVMKAGYDCLRHFDWRLAVATDNKEIADVVRGFDGNVIMTGAHPNGTSRIREAAQTLPFGYRWIINVQGDEPEINGSVLEPLLRNDSVDADVMTLATPIRNYDEFISPSVVKVVFNNLDRAMYFSRSPIPWCDDVGVAMSVNEIDRVVGGIRTIISTKSDFVYGNRHIGIYGYTRGFLESLSSAPDGSDDYVYRERLEQLTWLANGRKIAIKLIEHTHRGIDTRVDYEGFCKRQFRKELSDAKGS